MHRIPRLVIAVPALTLLVAACGSTDDNDTAANDGGGPRTVEIEMRDIAFTPESIDVEQGETVKFVFTNTGAVAHDAFIGDEAAQADHEMEMNETGDDEMGGDTGHGSSGSDDEGTAITVDPGETGELTYTFDDAGEVLIGCHQPGHYDAGMKLAVDVA